MLSSSSSKHKSPLPQLTSSLSHLDARTCPILPHRILMLLPTNAMVATQDTCSLEATGQIYLQLTANSRAWTDNWALQYPGSYKIKLTSCCEHNRSGMIQWLFLWCMYKHQNATKIKSMLLGAAPLGHQQLYLMGNAVMIAQWLAAVTQWHLGPKPPFPMDTISWKGFLPLASNLLWCHKHASEQQQCKREQCAEQLDTAGVINVSLSYQSEKHSGYFSLYTVSDHKCFIIKQRWDYNIRYWNTSPWG